jgi:oligopeptide transport system permease protein
MAPRAAALPHAASVARNGPFWESFRRLRQNRAAIISLTAIALLAIVAVFAEAIAPYDPTEQFLDSGSSSEVNPLAARSTGKFETPSLDHFFGTDQLARDIFSRSVVGLRISLSAALFAVVVVTLVGVAIGTLAATGPRLVDDVLMRLTDVAFAFPDLLLLILLRSALGDSLFGRSSVLGIDATVLVLFFAISVTAWPVMARLVRGQILSIRETDYVEAARSVGAGPWRVATRHMLPNAMSPVIVNATFLVPRVIAAEATLSFIGIGVTPPTPSLGLMISDHFSFVGITWTGLAIPCAVLVLLFLAFQYFGDGLRDALDPRIGYE